MQTNVSAGAEALKEISKEKARMFGKRVEALSPLEHAALAWQKRKEAEDRRRQKETLKREEVLGLSFHKAIAKELVDADRRRLADLARAESRDEAGWVQFDPWKKEQKGEKAKQIPLNMATVVAIRKKLVAMEWARALGKKRQDNRFYDLERQAAGWYQKREEEKRRKEEIAARIEKHKESLSETLAEFAKTLREKKDAATGSFRARSRAEVERLRVRRKTLGKVDAQSQEVKDPKELEAPSQEVKDPKELAVLLEESLANAGEVFDIEWQEDGCLIWIEPWEEKKLRRFSGFDIPIIYRARIDEKLQITSYEEVEDEEVIESLKEEILTRPLKRSLEGASFDLDDEEQAREFLEDKLSEIGRLINLERTESGWLATIEPWEEMRLRNIKRAGKPPVVTEAIEVNWKDGELEFAPEQEEEYLGEKEVVEIEGNEALVRR